VATNIYDALAGQSALDIFHEGAYPTGDPETRGGMYSRAKGYGGLIHLVNQYLDNQGLEPTQENYDKAFRAFGAGAATPVAAKVPEGESAMTAYFDRLLGRTPETKKKETLQEIMLEDESKDSQDDPEGLKIDPTNWIDTTIDYHDLYPSYNIIDFLGRGLGVPGGIAGHFSGSAKENKAKTAKVQEILGHLFTPEVIEALDKEKKDEGLKFSLEKAIQAVFGITDPAAKLKDEDYMGRAEDIFNVGTDTIEGLFGPEYTQEGESSKKDFEPWTREDFAWEGETRIDDKSAAEIAQDKEDAERQAKEAIEYVSSHAMENYRQGYLGHEQFKQIMEAADLDPDTGKPNEPVGGWTGLTLDDLKGRDPPGFWGPNDPSAHDPDLTAADKAELDAQPMSAETEAQLTDDWEDDPDAMF